MPLADGWAAEHQRWKVTASTPISIRVATPEDTAACARICYAAFDAIASQHGFPTDIPSVEVATAILGGLFTHPRMYCVVAERDGTIVGSNCLDERSLIGGIGPITVDPTAQDRGIGRLLMRAVLDRARAQHAPGVRLVQAAYHMRSLALYTSLGFVSRASLACLSGPPVHVAIPGYMVRPAVAADAQACDHVCRLVHGHDRGGELRDAIQRGTALVVEHNGRISGYCTGLAFHAHAVGETNETIMALIGGGQAIGGPGILVPIHNHALFEWCLRQHLRVTQLMTLMSMGLYNEPTGAYIPSVLY